MEVCDFLKQKFQCFSTMTMSWLTNKSGVCDSIHDLFIPDHWRSLINLINLWVWVTKNHPKKVTNFSSSGRRRPKDQRGLRWRQRRQRCFTGGRRSSNHRPRVLNELGPMFTSFLLNYKTTVLSGMFLEFPDRSLSGRICFTDHECFMSLMCTVWWWSVHESYSMMHSP